MTVDNVIKEITLDSLAKEDITEIFSRDQSTGELLNRIILRNNKLYLQKRTRSNFIESFKLLVGKSEGSLPRVTQYLRAVYSQELSALSDDWHNFDKVIILYAFIRLFEINVEKHNKEHRFLPTIPLICNDNYVRSNLFECLRSWSDEFLNLDTLQREEMMRNCVTLKEKITQVSNYFHDQGVLKIAHPKLYFIFLSPTIMEIECQKFEKLQNIIADMETLKNQAKFNLTVEDILADSFIPPKKITFSPYPDKDLPNNIIERLRQAQEYVLMTHSLTNYFYDLKLALQNNSSSPPTLNGSIKYNLAKHDCQIETQIHQLENSLKQHFNRL